MLTNFNVGDRVRIARPEGFRYRIHQGVECTITRIHTGNGEPDEHDPNPLYVVDTVPSSVNVYWERELDLVGITIQVN